MASRGRDPDIARFVGRAHLGECFVLWPRGGEPLLGFLTAMERDEAAATGCRLLDPERLEVRRLLEEAAPGGEFLAELLARAFRLAGLEPGGVALAGRFPAGDLLAACTRLERDGWRFVSGQRQVLGLRRAKSAEEADAARQVAAATAVAFRRVAELLAAATVVETELILEGERLTAGRLRTAVAEVCAAHGLEQPEGNIVAVGATAAVPHSQGDSRTPLRPGESIVVDLFPKGHLFADCTRTFCIGEAPEGLRSAHAAVADALRGSRRRAVPGARGWDLQRAVCEDFSAAGYDTPLSRPGGESGYVHNLGHGVGFELHELPSFRRRAGEEGVLEPGDLFTLEPGLYDPARGWGVRLEDLCLMEAGGPRNLTPLPYELDPRAW